MAKCEVKLSEERRKGLEKVISSGRAAARVLVPVIVLALPLYDMVVVSFIRIREDDVEQLEHDRRHPAEVPRPAGALEDVGERPGLHGDRPRRAAITQ